MIASKRLDFLVDETAGYLVLAGFVHDDDSAEVKVYLRAMAEDACAIPADTAPPAADVAVLAAQAGRSEPGMAPAGCRWCNDGGCPECER